MCCGSVCGLEGVDYGSFLEYQLRTMRVCDRKMLDMLRRAFVKLDHAGEGCFFPKVSLSRPDDTH